MKKTALFFLFTFLVLAAFPQDENKAPFRPSKHNFTVEVNFKPFSSETPITIDGFRGRLFLNDQFAIRIGANFGYKNQENETPEKHDNTIYYNSEKEHYLVLGVTSGLEYHFLKSKRFSPYIGFILGYENKSSGSTYEDVIYAGYPEGYTVTETEVKNGWRDTYYMYSGGGYYLEFTEITNRGYSKISGNFVLGADFYILRNVYLGIELGAGYNAIFYKKAEFTVDGNADIQYPKATESAFGLNVNNAIRVGFWF